MERNRTIVIEADPERRQQLSQLLVASGFDVTISADLAAALLEAARAAPSADGQPARRPTLSEIERRYAREVLRATGGNKTRAAEILGIDRKTLYRLIGAVPVRQPDAVAPVNGVDAPAAAAGRVNGI
ncbi:transcriptional regulator, Fis family [Anaeromyxobacter dehalogenans 2CP-1]|uniref:Transcriptional regulator, Fis family n=1 Tax=Anaeromyxobacter dehalogenans (strain ATCC BAA-258 / DSM 21875 / 2CP-1) TaxID=455488 RepID=B8J837_ANAD2|nr:helix-turn-helix domain-containing protein [Anaeromyxobacter dehalogenans]ACL65336.1 transcriptional regulator, Fis family [Anaeromyxobacter dehalogenans 2CP-1]